jgi:5-(carboxyamino)imidazole ribonucleotide mutase
VATFAIGEAGAVNAALFAIELLAYDDDQLHNALVEYRRKRHDDATSSVLPPT